MTDKTKKHIGQLDRSTDRLYRENGHNGKSQKGCFGGEKRQLQKLERK